MGNKIRLKLNSSTGETRGLLRFASDKLLSINEAAEYLGVKPNTIEVWLSTKRYPLKSVKLGRLRKFRQEDLDEFIAQAMEDTQNDCNLNKKGGYHV